MYVTLAYVQKLVDHAREEFNAGYIDSAKKDWIQIKEAINDLELSPPLRTSLRRSIHSRLDRLQLDSSPIYVDELLHEDTKIEMPVKSPAWLPY